MEQPKQLKIVIDTNLWISLAIGKRTTRLLDVIAHPEIQVIVSLELLKEVNSVLQKPKLQKILSLEKKQLVLELITDSVELVETHSDFKLERDAKDSFLLNLAFDSQANYLLTGDADLLDLKVFEHTKICTLSEFIDILDAL